MTKGWTEIDEPIHEIDGFYKTILNNSSILQILDDRGIEYSGAHNGNFTHKAKCPLPSHGGERTASFFVSEDNNDFYCFGCNASGTVIDLVVLCDGKPLHEAAKYLTKKFKITKDDVGCEKNDTESNKKITAAIYKVGIYVRNFLYEKRNEKNYKRIEKWTDHQFKIMDEYLDQLTDKDIDIVTEYCGKITKFLESKRK